MLLSPTLESPWLLPAAAPEFPLATSWIVADGDPETEADQTEDDDDDDADDLEVVDPVEPGVLEEVPTVDDFDEDDFDDDFDDDFEEDFEEEIERELDGEIGDGGESASDDDE